MSAKSTQFNPPLGALLCARRCVELTILDDLCIILVWLCLAEVSAGSEPSSSVIAASSALAHAWRQWNWIACLVSDGSDL